MVSKTKILVGMLILLGALLVSINASLAWGCAAGSSSQGCSYARCVECSGYGPCSGGSIHESSGPLFIHFGCADNADGGGLQCGICTDKCWTTKSNDVSCCNSFCKYNYLLYNVVNTYDSSGYIELYNYVNGSVGTPTSGRVFAEFYWSEDTSYNCFCYVDNPSNGNYLPNGVPALYYNDSGTLIPLDKVAYAKINYSMHYDESTGSSEFSSYETYDKQLLGGMGFNEGLCESGYVSEDGYCCSTECKGYCTLPDGSPGIHSCKTGSCECREISGIFGFGNWTTTVDFGKEVILIKMFIDNYYVDWSSFVVPPAPGTSNAPDRAPDVSYKKLSDTDWSVPTNASEIVLSVPGSPYQTDKLQIRAEFERATDAYGNPTTPILEKITIHTRPRLHGEQTDYFQGYCWPVEASATYSTELIHLSSSCTSKTQMCGETPCVIGYGVLNSVEYQENDTSNNLVSEDSGNYCWKGC
ncbi:MAG: hypothetical protein J7K73_03680 [Nanoarchaeota archaeon]|nr:hypothetical protein [Nanoarchaeota archaeon]